MRTISKPLFLPLLFLLAAAWGALDAHAAMIPQEWSVEVSRIKQYQFQANRGDTMELKATFWHKGEPFDLGGDTFRLYWQTNGMDSVYWSVPAASASNTVSAVFANTLDPGAPIVYGFLGATSGNYRASFAIRYAPGPGAVPNALPLPVATIDFSKVVALNAPWLLPVATNDIAAIKVDLADVTIDLANNYYTIEETDEAIDSLAAYYISSDAQGAAFATYAALTNATVYYSGGVIRVPTRNDYCVVLADESHGGAEWRYIYTVAAGATSGQWDAQYPIETNDYDGLSNKPQINGVSLSGNKTGADLGVLDLSGGTMTGDIMTRGAIWLSGQGTGEWTGILQLGTDYSLQALKNGVNIQSSFTKIIETANGDSTNYAKPADISAAISPTSPAFSNAVLSVGLGIDTNTVAVINELVDSAQDLPVTGATSVGALLLALAAAIAALKKRLPYALVTKTIENGVVTLDDRASNAVEISATLSPDTLTVNFPTATIGKVRDFALRLNIASGVTAPELVLPQGVVCENADGEVPEIADGGTGGSSTILYFSETENNGTTAKFLVKGEALTAITQA